MDVYQEVQRARSAKDATLKAARYQRINGGRCRVEFLRLPGQRLFRIMWAPGEDATREEVTPQTDP
jgi:hypothetical protein